MKLVVIWMSFMLFDFKKKRNNTDVIIIIAILLLEMRCFKSRSSRTATVSAIRRSYILLIQLTVNSFIILNQQSINAVRLQSAHSYCEQSRQEIIGGEMCILKESRVEEVLHSVSHRHT